MPAPGANMLMDGSLAIRRGFLKKLGFNSDGKTIRKQQVGKRDDDTDDGTTFPRQVALLAKHGAPADNEAADAPTGVGDLCWDSDNDDIYRCASYTDATTHDWVKIVD